MISFNIEKDAILNVMQSIAKKYKLEEPFIIALNVFI